MKSDDQIREELRSFLRETFFIGTTTMKLRDSDSLMDAGTVSSTGILEVVTFLEEHFGLEIDDQELLPENFDSIDRLVQFVGRKLRVAE